MRNSSNSLKLSSLSCKPLLISLFGGIVISGFAWAQLQPELSVKELMNAVITPTTSTIWGAYQLQTDAEWQQIENAALAVIAAGNLLSLGGAGEGEAEMAAEPSWQEYNQQMIAAARQVLVAVAAKDEEALSQAGNDALYPPCEACHQAYQSR